MKNEKLQNAVTQIDDRLIEEAASVKAPRRKTVGSALILAASLAVLLLTVGIVGGIGVMQKKGDTVSADIDTSGPDTAAVWRNDTVGEDTGELKPEIPWDEKTDMEKYPSLLFGDGEYGAAGYNVMFTVGEYLCDAALWGNNDKLDKNVTVTGRVYALAGISEKAFVAVELPGDDFGVYGYAVYMNHEYEPKSLGQMISDLRLSDYLKTDFLTVLSEKGTIEDDCPTYYIGTEDVMRLLDGCSDAFVAVNAMELVDGCLDTIITDPPIASISVTYGGIFGKSIQLRKSGYVYTNLVETGKVLKMPNNKLTDFLTEIYDRYEADFPDGTQSPAEIPE